MERQVGSRILGFWVDLEKVANPGVEADPGLLIGGLLGRWVGGVYEFWRFFN